MEHSKEYYQAFVMFLEDAYFKECKDYSYEEGSKIAGDYWMAICKLLQEEKIANVNYGDMHIIQFPPMLPILADCRAIVREMTNAEKDRRLNNADKWSAILFGIAGFIISLFSLYIAITKGC